MSEAVARAVGRGARCGQGDDRRRDRGRSAGAPAASSACGRCSSASTAARPSSMPRRRISTRPTRRPCSASRRTRRRSATAEGHDSGRRAEPDRAGDRVRLLLLPRRLRARATGAGFETIMVNCNPETVSTDPDTSDRLYFEPLTAEDVLEIVAARGGEGRIARRDRPTGRADPAQARGRAAGGGGADPRHLARQHRPCRRPRAVRQAGRKLGLKQPANGIARSRDEAMPVAERIGYPVLLRPSYVLGGRGMEVVDGPRAARPLHRDCGGGVGPSPVLIDRYLRDAIEVDVDAICDGKDVVVAGVLQHIEEAGVHSGDSACSIPPHSLSEAVVDEIERQTRGAGAGAEGRGLMNVQFAVQGRGRLSDRGQSARQPHGAVRRQGDRAAGRQDRRAGDGRRAAGGFGEIERDLDYIAVKESGVPLRALPGDRSRARTGNEEHRRSHGNR